MPIAHRIAAHRIISAPNGLRRMWRRSSPSSTAMPDMPSTRPTTLRRLSGSCSTTIATSVAHTGIVYARIALRPGGQLLHAEQHEPVPAGDVEERERRRRGPTMRAESRSIRRSSFATGSMPSAANGSVSARNVSGGISVDAELQHRPVAAPDEREDRDRQRTRARSAWRRGRRGCVHQRSRGAQRLAVLALVQLARLRDPAVAPDAAGKLGSFASNSSMSRSVQRAICRYVVTPSWCSIRSSTGPMPTMSFRSSGESGPSSSGGGALFSMSTTSCAVARGLRARGGERIAAARRRSSANASASQRAAALGLRGAHERALSAS